MTKHYSDHEINEMLFEDLPSFDDTEDDETYFPEHNNNNTLLVVESDSDSDENLEILNIEENVTYFLPSPRKMRSSNRRKNPNTSTTNYSANCRELFSNNENHQILEELAVPILT